MATFKYKEDVFFNDLRNYIESTYGEHYVNDGKLQVVDVWHARGSLSSTAIDTALKYLMRYGKKDGKNKKDLMKAVHYIMLTMYTDGLLEDTKFSQIITTDLSQLITTDKLYDETHLGPLIEDNPYEHGTRGFPT